MDDELQTLYQKLYTLTLEIDDMEQFMKTFSKPNPIMQRQLQKKKAVVQTLRQE
jgi:hypothetical protein